MFMRSRFALSLIPALAIGTAACGKKTPPPEPTKAPPAETTPAEPDVAAATPDVAAATPDAAAATPDAAAMAPDAAAAGDAAAAAVDAAAAAPATTPTWSLEGFAKPESVLADGEVYLVSNVNGEATDKDDNGFISKVGADGKIIELKWIDGAKADVELNAPKGMGILGGVLYVSDIDTVRKFDAKTGAPLGAIAIANATFLNDIAAPADGKTLYVSDSAIGPDFEPKGTAAIYAITGDEAPRALEISAIGLPNGVDVEVTPAGDVVYFNGFDDSKVVHRFDIATKTDTTVAVPGGGLDGLAVVKDGDMTWYVVTSWETGSVYKIDKDGKATVIASGLKGPADLEVDVAKKLVIVPLMMENRIAAFPL